MPALNQQPKAQILIISDNSAAWCLWHKGRMRREHELEHSAEARAELSHMLVEHRKWPLIIVTDFTEESFRNEHVVHVREPDRSALLERRVAQSFRSTHFRSARITGRETTGNKEDNVLFSALTRPELIQPWTELALEYEIPIQAVTSMPYMIEDFAADRSLKNINNLLISTLENDLRLRQTFLRKGKLLFSRVTNLSAGDNANLSTEIKQETNRIHSYLNRIRLLDFEDNLQLHFFAEHQGIIEGLEFSEDEKTDVAYVSTASSSQLGKDADHRNIIRFFLEHVLTHKQVVNIYAQPDIRRFHLYRNTSRWLGRASVLLILFAMIYKAPVAWSIWEKWQQERVNYVTSGPYEQQYSVLSAQFPETPIPSGKMKLVVETLEKITNQSADPVYITEALTAALARSPELNILKIEWELATETAATTPYAYMSNTNPAFQTAVLAEETHLKVLIDGLAFSSGSYTEAQNRVLEFAYALDALPGVTVTPLRMPTDVRIDVAISTTVGVDDLQAPFTLELLMEMNP